MKAFVYPCVWQIGRHEKKTKSDKQRNPQVLCVSIRTFNLNVKTDKKNKKKTGIGRLRNRQSNIDIELSHWGRACGSYTVVAIDAVGRSRLHVLHKRQRTTAGRSVAQRDAGDTTA